LKLPSVDYSRGLPGALWNFEEAQLKRLVEAETAAPSIRGIFVFDDKKQIIGRITGQEGEIVDSLLPEDTGSMKEGKLEYVEGTEKNSVGRVVV
jgi:hypothetical protein